MKKLNVGDIIVIRKDLQVGKMYDGCTVHTEMQQYFGEQLAIDHIEIFKGLTLFYRANGCAWSCEMVDWEKTESLNQNSLGQLCDNYIEDMLANNGFKDKHRWELSTEQLKELVDKLNKKSNELALFAKAISAYAEGVEKLSALFEVIV